MRLGVVRLATPYSLLSPKSREPQNTPNTRKNDIKVGGFISGCLVCSVVKKNGIATQDRDHLPDGVGLPVDLHRTLLRLYFAERVFVDDLPVDRIVHELPSELDPFVDRRRGHPLLVCTSSDYQSRESKSRGLNWPMKHESMHTITGGMRLGRANSAV